jgi:C1A family cysteine protease
MKYSKRYISFTILLVLVLLIRFQVLGTDLAEIGQFRGGELAAEVWNPLIADDVNGSLLRVVIDNKEYTNENVPFYMNEDRSIMVPVSILRDALNCSAHVYDEEELLVEKHNSSVSFRLDEPLAVAGDELVSITSAFTKYGDSYYVSLSDLSGLLGYSCSFDIASRTLTTADTSESTTIVPSRYDLREKGRVSKVRNQGTYGTCWGFAATSALESVLLPEQQELFSVDHMTLCNSFNVNQYDGGEYTMGMAYLAAWQGPVYEADDPYGDGVSDESLTAVKHVQEMRIIDGKDYEAIKTAVFKYGGVQTSLYSNLKSSMSGSEYYNRETSAYCYIGTEKPNHDVVIIGWDDNYSKDNFSVPLEGDGAFICQNSWGENFGENGVFYVSYYDTNIGTHNVVYTRVEETDNYDHIYQSDLCGWVGSMGYDKEYIYGANVFTAQQAEKIAAAGFYATGSDTQYEVYVVSNFEDVSSFAERKKVAEGTLDQAGYYTIDFSTAVSVEKGERFAILLYLSTPGATHPLAIEYDSGDDSHSTVDLSDGEGYISANGVKFTDVNELQECNLCIKAYTNEKS